MQHHALAFAAAALLTVGCGPSPAYYDLREPAPEAPQPEAFEESASVGVHVEIATDDNDTPFSPGEAWLGKYRCPQGVTKLALRIEHAAGSGVTAIFDFDHEESGARGSYLVSGTYDSEQRTLALAPVRWIEQPEGYEMVGLEGHVAGRRFWGRITDEHCGSFSVKRGR